MATVPKYDVNKLLNLDKEKTTSTYDPIKQVEGLKTRLEGSGIDAKAQDSRNLLERALNLTPDQNTLFDVFEIINRPQQALFGAIKAQQEGKDAGKAALEGLKGNVDTRFADILHNAGMSDSEEKLGVDDVLGFIGDVFLDPVDLALIPITAPAKVAETALEVGTDISKAKKLVSPLELAAKGTKKAIGASARVVDRGVSGLFKYIDDSEILASIVSKSGKQLELVQGYTDIKKAMTRIFDAAKDLPKGLWEKAMNIRGAEKKAKLFLSKLNEDTFYAISKYADETGQTVEKVSKDVMGYIEYNKLSYAGNIVDDVINNPKQILDEDLYQKMSTIAERLEENIDDIYQKALIGGNEVYVVKSQSKFTTLSNKIKKARKHYSPTPPINTAGMTLDEINLVSQELLTKEVIKGEWADDLEKLASDTKELPRVYSSEQTQLYNSLSQDSKFVELVGTSSANLQKSLQLMEAIFKKVSDNPLKFGKLGEGYVPHAQTDIATDLQQIYFNADTALSGRVDAFTSRQYKMSAEEANAVARAQIDVLKSQDKLNKNITAFLANTENYKLFEESFNMSMADFINKAPNFAKNEKMIEEILVTSWGNSPDIIRPLEKGAKVPAGFVSIKKDDMIKKLRGFKGYTENEKVFDKLIKDINRNVDKDIIVDENVFQMIGRLGENKEVRGLVRFVNTMNNAFKQFKLLSPGFQMRNIVGNSTNMFLAGMNPNDIAKYTKRAHNILSKSDDMVKRVSLAGGNLDVLSAAEKADYKVFDEFLRNNFNDVADEIWDIDSIVAKKGEAFRDKLTAVQRLNAKANTAADKRFRLAMLMWAKDNPQMVTKAGLNTPAEMVRRALFDPHDLSAVEQTYLKKVIPFYTFAKKNIAYQMENVFENPVRYNQIKKAVASIWNTQGIDVNDIEAYKKENFWIPIPGLTKDGKYFALKANLPIGDLGEFITNPLQKVVSATAPIIRAPFELAVNKQAFLGQPIEEFKGQQGLTIPWMSRKGEYLLGQTGLDVPVSQLTDIARAGSDLVKGDTTAGQAAFDAFGRSVISQGSTQQAANTQAYAELERLRGLVKYYKQEGVDILTMAEIQNQNQGLQQVLARIKSL